MEDARPVGSHLVSAADGAAGAERLRALIIGRETSYEGIDVVLILRLVQRAMTVLESAIMLDLTDGFFHCHDNAA